jgi:hypothetical protein
MNVRLKYDIPFTAGVYYNSSLRMNNYSLRLWMTTNSIDPADQNISFERLKYFVYSEIDSTIFINSEHTEQCRQYIRAGLNITTLPGEPVDQLVGIMLYYKLNAVTEDRMIIVETELSSTYGEDMTYLHSEHEITDDIIKPDWWNSSDIVHCDVQLIDTDKVVAMHRASAWRDLNLAWPDDTVLGETGNTVVFADFKRSDDTE